MLFQVFLFNNYFSIFKEIKSFWSSIAHCPYETRPRVRRRILDNSPSPGADFRAEVGPMKVPQDTRLCGRAPREKEGAPLSSYRDV